MAAIVTRQATLLLVEVLGLKEEGLGFLAMPPKKACSAAQKHGKEREISAVETCGTGIGTFMAIAFFRLSNSCLCICLAASTTCSFLAAIQAARSKGIFAACIAVAMAAYMDIYYDIGIEFCRGNVKQKFLWLCRCHALLSQLVTKSAKKIVF